MDNSLFLNNPISKQDESGKGDETYNLRDLFSFVVQNLKDSELSYLQNEITKEMNVRYSVL